MKTISISDRLRDMLHKIFPDAKDVSAQREITINCPLCEMQGDPDKGKHMYISLGLDGKPPMFNCFRRTGHSGLLTTHALEQLSHYSQYIDTELMDEIKKQTMVSSIYGRTQAIREEKMPLIVNHNKSTEKYTKKIEYISNRIGIPFNIQMVQENKIILGLYDFLEYNHINTLTRDSRIVEELDNNFVGFLTNTNTSIIMRNLYEGGLGRYIKYNVINNAPISYYVIPSDCDLYKPIELHIAEGTFDILSIFYNLHNGDRKNKIYAAIGSKAYLNLIRYFLTEMGIVNMTLHIYIDRNIESEILNSIRRWLYPIGIETIIHINSYKNEKDFGVPKNKIRDYSYIL